MPRVRTLTPGVSPRHHFGAEVRRARNETGMTLAELGALVPCDESTGSRIEAGLIAPDLHFAEVCDRAFPFCRGWFARFFADSADWAENTAFPPAFRKFSDDEAEATALYSFEHALLPGLLQTEDYARAVLSKHPGVTDAQIDDRVAGRLDRQNVLTRDDPPFAWFVIDVSALNRDVGGPKLMHDALWHLADMARRPNITVQVVADAVHVGLQGSFIIAESSGTSNSANLEDANDGRTIDDAGTVNVLSMRFRHLQTVAMTPTESLGAIERIADGFVAQIELQRHQRRQLHRSSRQRRRDPGPRHHRPRRRDDNRVGRRLGTVHDSDQADSLTWTCRQPSGHPGQRMPAFREGA